MAGNSHLMSTDVCEGGYLCTKGHLPGHPDVIRWKLTILGSNMCCLQYKSLYGQIYFQGGTSSLSHSLFKPTYFQKSSLVLKYYIVNKLTY